MGVKCTDLRMENIGSSTSMVCKWHCGADNKDHFVVWFYYNPPGKASWIRDGSKTVNLPNMSSGWYHVDYNPPAPSKARMVKFEVRPYASKDDDGDEYWSGETTGSGAYFTPEHHQVAYERNDQAKLGDSYYSKAVSYWTNDRNNAVKKSDWEKAVAACEKGLSAAESAFECFDKALKLNDQEMGGDGGGDTALWYGSFSRGTCIDRRKKIKFNSDSYLNVVGKARDTYANNLVDYYKKIRSGYLGSAAKQKEAANANKTKAAAERKKATEAGYKNAASYETTASSQYKAASDYYAKAVDLDRKHGWDSWQASDTTLKNNCDTAKTNADNRAKTAKQLYADLKAINDAKKATPARPTARHVGANEWTPRIEVTAPAWTNKVTVERDVDGAGKWAKVKDITRTANSSSWTSTYADSTVEAGHSYRYRFKCASQWASKESAYALNPNNATAFGPYAQKPLPSTNFRATLSGSDSVILTWTNQGKTGSAFELQYSSYVGQNSKGKNDNAWNCGATDQIRKVDVGTASATSGTVAGLEQGKRWYFRVVRKNAAGSAIARRYDWTQNNQVATAAVDVPAPSVKLNKVTALKAQTQDANHPANVKLTWTDNLESGTYYEIQYSSNMAALTDNVLTAIHTDRFDENMGIVGKSDSRVYTVEGLDLGVQYWFRVVKVNGTQKLASGTVKLKTPASVSSSIAVPASVTAASPRDGAVRVEWRCAATSGESFEVERTASATAFTYNELDEIETATLEEPNVSGTGQVITMTGLETGVTWYCRVRKCTSEAKGQWSEVVECELPPGEDSGEGLAAPICADSPAAWDITRGFVISWSHNSQSGAGQTAYEVEARRSTMTETTEVSTDLQIPQGGASMALSLDLEELGFTDGEVLSWRVRTQGAIDGYWSPWSRTQRTSVYSPPSVGASLSCAGDPVDSDNPLTSMPLSVSVEATDGAGNALSAGNAPLRYDFEIVAAGGFSSMSDDGTSRYVAAGEVVYRKSVSAGGEGFPSGAWEFDVPSRDLMLAGGGSYAARAHVLTATGMSATSQDAEFDVQWSGELPDPEAAVIWDPETYTCTISPRCVEARLDEPGWLEPAGFSWRAVEPEDENWYDEEEVEGGDAEQDPMDDGTSPYSDQHPDLSCERVSNNGDGTCTAYITVEGGYGAMAAGDVVYGAIDGVFAIPLSYGVETMLTLDMDGSLALYAVVLEGAAPAEPEDPEEEPEQLPATATEEEYAAAAELGIGDEEYPFDVMPDATDGTDDPEPTAEGLVEGVTLDVYRVNSDGSTVLVAEGLPNDGFASCLDPHPHFGWCSYRIVARDPGSGVISTSDAGAQCDCRYIVIQWDGDWRQDEVAYDGEQVVLPYNIQYDYSWDGDSELRAYFGREAPVPYWGSQLGIGMRLSSDLVRGASDDEQAALYRLARHRGACYVRYGDWGYWAVVKPSLSGGYGEAKVAVTLEVTRIDRSDA